MRYACIISALVAWMGSAPAMADDMLDHHGYNRWECSAYGYFGHRYEGYSDWFRPGSGFGQYAHRRAYDRALDECRHHSYMHDCHSDFDSDCYVIRR